MKTLEKGKYAISIAHPGHELRLYGFMEKLKPFIFILTDGGPAGDGSRMERSLTMLGNIYKHTAIIAKDKRDVVYVIERPNPEKGQEIYMKDYEMIHEVEKGNTAFFEFYVKKMANTLLFNKINYVITDSREGYNLVHDLNRMLTEAAIRLVKEKAGKEIALYEFNISKPFNTNINEDCIQIELDEETQKNKATYILQYHKDVFLELKPDLNVDVNFINKISEMQAGFNEIINTLLSFNPDFFKYEYLRPATYNIPDENYTRHIIPVKEKLYS